MPSQLKSDTARANGAKSHGPKSAATRAISSRSSLRHGFTSRHTTLLDCENPEEFQEILTSHFATYQPAGPTQENLLNEMISAHWRIRRVRIVETQLLDLQMVRNKPEVEKQYIDPGATVHMAEAFRTLIEDSRALSLISRYESRLYRIHERSYRTLRELQRAQHVEPQSTLSEPAQPDPPNCKSDETNPPQAASSQRDTPPRTPQRNEPTPISKLRLKLTRRSQSSSISARLTIAKRLRRN